VPQQVPTVELKAVAVTPDRAARLTAMDLNIVAQTADLPDSERFDLVVATNILVYYDHFQQALAMTNVARMMKPGGIFVSNTPLPAAHDERLKYLGGRSVVYAQDGSYGDDIVVYQKQ
jgi:chemotaxis methyl-accepting protein methylase